MSEVSLERCLRGRYEIETETTERPAGGQIVEAWYPKIPGCIAQGEDEAEAIERLEESKEPYLRQMAEDDVELPVPDFDVVTAPDTISADSGGLRVTQTDEEPDFESSGSKGMQATEGEHLAAGRGAGEAA